MKKLTIFWIIGRVIDILTTYVGITFMGLKEANPIAKAIFDNTYILGLIFFTMLLTIIFIIGAKYVIREGGKIGLFCLYIVVLVSFIPVINNLILLFTL